MKSNIYIEYQGEKISAKQIENAFRELWKDEGGKIKDLSEVDLYYKPEEKACYYFVPETDASGKIQL